jgi:hypothetical protein
VQLSDLSAFCVSPDKFVFVGSFYSEVALQKAEGAYLSTS